MKKRILFLFLSLLALTGTALAVQHTDGSGAVWDTDETGYYAPEAPAALAAALVEDLTPLGDPTNLCWSAEVPGDVHWEIPGTFQRKIAIKFYEVNQPDTPVWKTTVTYSAQQEIHSFKNSLFRLHCSISDQQPRLGSGRYYFTLQSLGDGTTYGDSALVSSLDAPDGAGVYDYVEPAEGTALETPSAGHWEWPAAIWDDRQTSDERIRTYAVDYGYSRTADEAIYPIGGDSSGRSGRESSWLQERLIGEHGAGWYYFRVRAVSADIEQWRNGEWSEWSKGYNLAEAAQSVTNTLNAIDKNKPEDIRSQVQALNRTELKNALTADILTAGTGAADAMSTLEKALNCPSSARVAPELADRFDAGGVSVVGAALNNVTGTPVLNIGAPKQDNHVRSENYNNTLAVDFSMELSNVESTEDLAVPVKVTLPIPAGVNPDFLAILHYRTDGTFEELLHTVFEKDGARYVSFVLTHFSDFTLTERLEMDGAPSIVVNPDGRYQAFHAPAGAALFLSRYEGGRMTSLKELKELSGTLTGGGKLFLLDGDLRPLCAAKELLL